MNLNTQAIAMTTFNLKTENETTTLKVLASAPHFELTPREEEILRCMALGHTSVQMAMLLYLSKKTVDTHRRNIIKKMGVTNVAAAVAFALRNGLIR